MYGANLLATAPYMMTHESNPHISINQFHDVLIMTPHCSVASFVWDLYSSFICFSAFPLGFSVMFVCLFLFCIIFISVYVPCFTVCVPCLAFFVTLEMSLTCKSVEALKLLQYTVQVTQEFSCAQSSRTPGPSLTTAAALQLSGR